MTHVVVISGLSGSGKTQVLRSVEDMGFFAVDNLPVPLILSFVELLERSLEEEPRGGFVVDVRDRQNLAVLPSVLAELRGRSNLKLTILFLDARDETLLRRFSETRRPHPLSQIGPAGMEAAIHEERTLLGPVRAMADRILTTDGMSPHRLRAVIKETLSSGSVVPSLQCQVVSFGFKYGPPREADMLFDVRFLTNPYFVPELKEFDGRDERVVRFLEQSTDYEEFIGILERLIGFVLPRFVSEGKSYLTIAIGCTGGRHRSVAIGERLGGFLKQSGFPCVVVHRDVGHEAGGSRP